MSIDPSDYERAAAQLVADAQAVVDHADAVARTRDARRDLGARAARAVVLPEGAGPVRTPIGARIRSRLSRIQLTE
jgi:hypothetical protein